MTPTHMFAKKIVFLSYGTITIAYMYVHVYRQRGSIYHSYMCRYE